ncbi:MAG: hypothetical protein WA765_12535 [Candidatus Acidiferrum sp.]
MIHKSKQKRPKAKPGPKAETLKIKGNWQRAMKTSLTKKKPPEGWPK